jgi:hypothetical protein
VRWRVSPSVRERATDRTIFAMPPGDPSQTSSQPRRGARSRACVPERDLWPTPEWLVIRAQSATNEQGLGKRWATREDLLLGRLGFEAGRPRSRCRPCVQVVWRSLKQRHRVPGTFTRENVVTSRSQIDKLGSWSICVPGPLKSDYVKS